MMKRIDVDSWEEFEDQLRDLRNERTERQNSVFTQISPFLYRGQGNASWHALTTLERQRQVLNNIPLSQYYQTINRIRPEIELFTGLRWSVREFPQYEKWTKERDLGLMLMELENPRNTDEYRYMAYLRHYGFPSPLLDWTRSPYVAAYFAFSGLGRMSIDQVPERVSIHVLWERPDGLKVRSSNDPYIYVFRPYVRAHQRHFLQQSQYTMCISYSEPTDEWRYTQHEEAFSRAAGNQDIVWQYTIPSREWRQVLHILDAYSLNAFSLFGSIDSLMESLALREMSLNERGL